MKHIVQASRYLLALTFIFSGFVKGVDPLGSAYKFHDYFLSFHMGFMEPLTLFLSFVLCASELFIGLLLLFGIRLRLASLGALVFMGIFTPLTLYLAIFNPVSDCGCFGDAVHLSNWETFLKNLVFLAAAILLFMKRETVVIAHRKNFEVAAFLVLLAVSFIPPIDGYTHLPAIDFRPYKVGVSIPESMAVPPGVPVDEYKTTLYYEKNGVVKQFDESNYPWQDSTWRFVDSKSVLVKKGYTPPITNFSLIDRHGFDVTDSILKWTGYYFLAIAPRIDKTSKKSVEKLNELYFRARELGYGFACVTASPQGDIDLFVGATGAAFPFLNADEITLKTIVRANPGLMLLYQGRIIGKWHHNHLPDAAYLNGDMLSAQMLKLHRMAVSRLSYLIVSLLALAFLGYRMGIERYTRL
jgi:uncharacterized membrane protein YphA (DoxX/SURF4 family)